MTDSRQNTRPIPRLLINPDAVAARLETLDSTPLCDSCRAAILPATADAVASLLEVIRLWNALADTRLQSANRLAAIQAALSAAADNESDPLAFLRDQLADETAGMCGSGR